MATVNDCSVAGGGCDGARTIFVSIPSYRDPECQYTVRDLFQKAKTPDRVRVGICWQCDKEADTHCFLLDLSEHAEKIRTVTVHHSEARGPCYARALIQQKLFADETYYLQLDSHYRMIEGWDEELISQLAKCNSDKPVLTTYPSSYTLPEDYVPGGPDAARLNPNNNPIVVCAREFGADGFLRTNGKVCHPELIGRAPPSALFWAAGFAFSSSAVVREVPYDPLLEDLFFGEESTMAARLWTSAWDFFAPTCVVGYHLWSRKHRPVFREHAGEAQRQREAASQARAKALLEPPEGAGDAEGASRGGAGRHGLGTARSLAAYEEFCGVSFAKRTISARARRGGLDGAVFVDGDPGAAAPSTPASTPQVPMAALALAAAAATAGANGKGVGRASGVAPALGLIPSQAAAAIQSMLGGELLEAPGSDAHQPSAAPPRLLTPPVGQEATWRQALKLLRPEEVDDLNRHGFVVVDGFLERTYTPLGATLAAAAPHIALAGAMQAPVRPARLGRGDRLWSSAAVRGDEMTWLSAPTGPGAAERAEVRVRLGLGLAEESSGNLCSGNALAPACVASGAARCSGSGVSAPRGPESAKSGCSEEFDVLSAKLMAEYTVPKTNSDSQKAPDAPPPGAPLYEDLDVLLVQLVALRSELDKVFNFECSRLSVMAAKYPGGGARYARHRDALPEHQGERRRLTAVYYLNSDWVPENGGCLRAYFPEEVGINLRGASLAKADANCQGEWALDIEPKLDRLVLFASEWLEHEVLPSHADRYAVTMWLY